MQITRIVGAGMVAAALAGCGGSDSQAAAATSGQPAAPAAGTAATLGQPVAPTGTVHEIRMITDETGNRFEPDTVAANRGDVLRFVLANGVHHVSFPGLPAPGPLLQVPEQTYDVAVGVAPGTYAFQCDPHAALGMVGTLTVR